MFYENLDEKSAMNRRRQLISGQLSKGNDLLRKFFHWFWEFDFDDLK